MILSTGIILGWKTRTFTRSQSFSKKGKNIIAEDRIKFSISPEDDAKELINKCFEKGGKSLGISCLCSSLDDVVKYERKEKPEEYEILARDSRGNYTALAGRDNKEYSIRRVITYWDDLAAASTSRELTLNDMLSKPLGIIENESESLWSIDPEKVVSFVRENSGWSYTDKYGILRIVEGYDRSFKGYPLHSRINHQPDSNVKYHYSYSYTVKLDYDNPESMASTFYELEKLFNIVIEEFKDMGIDFSLGRTKQQRIATADYSDTHIEVTMSAPLDLDGEKPFWPYNYVTVSMCKR